MNFKKDDTIKVIYGDDRGKQGKVIKVFREDGKVLIQGVNIHWKHVKRGKEYPHGARIQKEFPISASNVMLICPTCNKPTRIGYGVSEAGIKNRVCKKCKKPVFQE
ncbi:MAG: 50S ribosomal protein L24 [Candidatus Brocadiia bacterium]